MGEPVTVQRVVTAARRLPATTVLALVLLGVGVASAGLWSPFAASPLHDTVAYGLPALEAGRWWTPVTGTFFVSVPWLYAPVIVGLVGMGFLEFRRGSRVAASYFVGGQLGAVLGASLVLWLAALLPWTWAQEQAGSLDVGPSPGVIACLAAAVSLLPSPWRLRAWTVLIAVLSVTFLYWGSLNDLEHVLAAALVLIVDRSLRPQRVPVREQRLIAFVVVCGLGAIDVLTYLSPTTGPFGSSEPVSGSWVDVAVNTVVVLVVANGIRRGRRWAWVLLVAYGILNALLLVLVALLIVAIGPRMIPPPDPAPFVTMELSGTWAFVDRAVTPTSGPLKVDVEIGNMTDAQIFGRLVVTVDRQPLADHTEVNVGAGARIIEAVVLPPLAGGCAHDVTIGLELVAQASTSGSEYSALPDVTPSPLQFFVGQNNASQPC